MKANTAYKLADMDGGNKAFIHYSLEIAGKPDAVTACGILITSKWQIDFNDIVVTCPKCLKWGGVDEIEIEIEESDAKPEKGTEAYKTAMIERLIEGTEMYIEGIEAEIQEEKENVDWDALDEIEYYKEAVNEINNQLSIEAKKETT